MTRIASISLLLMSAAFAQPTRPYDDALEAMKKRDAIEKAVADTVDRKTWDYVTADKKAGTVTVMACGSIIKPTDPVEFLLATIDSGKDYESLAVTPAKPGDIKAAMEFIGLRPGLPIDPEQNRYWPRGQRTSVTFAVAGRPVRAEELVLDSTTKRSLPTSGLVFTGSYTHAGEQGEPQLAADKVDNKPIAPLYNDPAALLDLPRQASQSAVYGFQRPSAAWTAKAGETTELTLAPAAGAASVDELNAVVKVELRDGRPLYGFDTWPNGPVRTKGALHFDWSADLPHLLSMIAAKADGSCDLFTTVKLDGGVSVEEVRKLYAVLQSVERDHGVKLDPPPPATGDLFYRAFFPKPEWRDRATRLGEPWELFLSRDAAGKITAKLERAVDNPDRAGGGAKYVVESITPADPAAFVKTVNDKASRWSKAVFVYPPADLTYGELIDWVRPVLATYPRVFVFPADPATTQPATGAAARPTLEPK